MTLIYIYSSPHVDCTSAEKVKLTANVLIYELKVHLMLRLESSKFSEYRVHFIIITPRFTLTWSYSPVKISFIVQIELLFIHNTWNPSSCRDTYQPSRKWSKLDEPGIQDTAGKVGTNSYVTYSSGPLHMDEQRQDDQLEPTYNSSVPIQDVALKTDRKRWTIEKGGGRGSGRSVLMMQHDADDDTWNHLSLCKQMIDIKLNN